MTPLSEPIAIARMDRDSERFVRFAQPRLSVLMPAFNEANRIAANLLETIASLDVFEPHSEIIVIDDGSADGTYEEVQVLAALYPRRIVAIRLNVNEGKGGALRAGVKAARGDLLAFLDADLDLHPRQLELFIRMMTTRDADVVIGSKMHPDSSVDYPASRRILSAGYYQLIKLLFALPVRDTQTGLKLFRAEALRTNITDLQVRGFAFDIELLALIQRAGFRIIEAPIELDFKRVNTRISLMAIAQMFFDTLGIFRRLCRLKKPVHDGTQTRCTTATIAVRAGLE
ncbi:MAG TPA: glycosyltransferase [Candidatus Baltobacteraceae bacterium]|nr:glycosyltransferase [Candidatus Baltobacteraceae bacterium]